MIFESDFFEDIKPIYMICKFFGNAPYSVTGVFYKRYFKTTIYDKIMLVFQIITMLYLTWWMVAVYYKELFSGQGLFAKRVHYGAMDVVLEKIAVALPPVVLFTNMFCSTVYTKTFIGIYSELLKFELYMRKLKIIRQTTRKFVKKCLYSFAINFITWIVLCLATSGYSHQNWINIILFLIYFMFFLSSTLSAIICEITLLRTIYTNFKILIGVINALEFQNASFALKQLKIIMNLNDNLTNVASEILKIYALPKLINFTVAFYTVVQCMYVFVKTFNTDVGDDLKFAGLLTILLLLVIVFFIFLWYHITQNMVSREFFWSLRF